MIRVPSLAGKVTVPFVALACGLAWAPAHAARAYVSNEDDGTVSVVDTQRLESVATISVCLTMSTHCG